MRLFPCCDCSCIPLPFTLLILLYCFFSLHNFRYPFVVFHLLVTVNIFSTFPTVYFTVLFVFVEGFLVPITYAVMFSWLDLFVVCIVCFLYFCSCSCSCWVISMSYLSLLFHILYPLPWLLTSAFPNLYI